MHPFIHITETLYIPSYVLVISLTYCFCLIWADRRAQKQNRSRNMTLDIALAIMIGGFFGARLFHVFYEAPEIYLADPLRILKVWEGGFVFFGGLIGALAASYFFIRHKGESFMEWADFFAPVLALGYAVGRIGCFLNGCCYGDLCDLPWAVEFNFPGLPTGARHPTQLYATFYELAVFALLLGLKKRVFLTWLFLHSIGRLLMEAFRADERGPEFGLSVSSWISIVILIISGQLLVSSIAKKGTPTDNASSEQK